MWWCDAWKLAKTPFLTEVMLLAKAIKRRGYPLGPRAYGSAGSCRSPWYDQRTMQNVVRIVTGLEKHANVCTSFSWH